MNSTSNRLATGVLGVLGLLSLLVMQTGCTGREGIASYTAPKEDVNEAGLIPPRPTRMLAAIVPWGEQAWFFKIMGPDQPVADASNTFEEFLASLKFTDDKPDWTLPEGWKQVPGSSLRYATLQLPSEDPALEMSVTVLGKPPGDDTAYLLANINRWRGQVNLPPLEAAELAGQSRRMQVAGVEATLVDYLGTSRGGGGMAPFAGMAGGGGQPDAKAVLSYDAPDGWEKGPAGGLRKAAFKVADGEREAEITIIDLAAAAGDLLPNVNRWRGQVSLGEISQAELKTALEEIQVGDVKGKYVKLIGPAGAKPGAILGVIAVRGNRAWFVKLSGDAGLAQREEDRFKAFVRSIRFN